MLKLRPHIGQKMKLKTCVLILLRLTSESASQVVSYKFDDELRPENVLPKYYDQTRPPTNRGEVPEVKFHITVVKINNIDENESTFRAVIFLSQTWKDSRLKLPVETILDERRKLPAGVVDKIWTPEVTFVDAKSVHLETVPVTNQYTWFFEDGAISHTTKYTLELFCPIYLVNYPHDTQFCRIAMESLSEDVNAASFVWDPLLPFDIDASIKIPGFEMANSSAEDCTTEYSTGKFSCLELVLKLERRIGNVFLTTYLPAIIVVVVSWLTLLVSPHDIGARLTVGLLCLLTLIALHVVNLRSLPPVSYLKAIDIFMLACGFFIFIGILEAVLVNKLREAPRAQDGGKKGRFSGRIALPQWTDRVFAVLVFSSFVVFNVIYWNVY